MKRLVVLALTLLIFFTGVFCIGINAESEPPSVTIKGNLLSLESTIYIVYYTQPQNVPVGAERGLLIWTEIPENGEYTYATANKRITTPIADSNYPGWDRFEYKDLAAKQMTKNVYAKAYIKDGDNIVYSSLSKYSILQYITNQLAKTNIADNYRALLEGMLSYGAAAQTYFGYETDRLATDTYYKVSVKEGTILADGTASGLYKEGDIITLSATSENFDHWENSKGETVGFDKILKVAVGDSAETYTATENIVERHNVITCEFTDNGNGTTTADISVKGDVNLFGLEFRMTIATEGMEYVNVTAEANGAAANCTDGSNLIFSYTSSNGSDITSETHMLSITFNNTAIQREAIMTVYGVDIFDDTFKDESFSVVGTVYSNE